MLLKWVENVNIIVIIVSVQTRKISLSLLLIKIVIGRVFIVYPNPTYTGQFHLSFFVQNHGNRDSTIQAPADLND